MEASAYRGEEVRGGSRYHVADILPAALKSALLALVVDTDEQTFSAVGTRTIVVLKALDVIL